MRIVHIIYALNVGGAETMLCDIANEQAQSQSDNIYVIIINDSIDESVISRFSPSVHLILLRRRPGTKSITSLIKLNYIIRKIEPDVIHAHQNSIINLLFYRCPKFLTIHSLSKVLSMSSAKFYTLFAISDAVYADVKFRYGDKFHVVTVPNGVNVHKIQKRDKTLDTDSVRIVQVARLNCDCKGQDILVKAMLILKERGIGNVFLDFIGDGNDHITLQTMIDNYGLSDNVKLCGAKSRDYIYSHIKDYDLMCHPARSEGFGLTIVEAMAARVPVIVSNSGGPYEIINRGQYGQYFESGSADDLADVIISFCENRAQIEDKYVESAYDYVCDNFSVRRMVSSYYSEYKKGIMFYSGK